MGMNPNNMMSSQQMIQGLSNFTSGPTEMGNSFLSGLNQSAGLTTPTGMSALTPPGAINQMPTAGMNQMPTTGMNQMPTGNMNSMPILSPTGGMNQMNNIIPGQPNYGGILNFTN